MSGLFKNAKVNLNLGAPITKSDTPWMEFMSAKLGWTEFDHDKELSKYWKYTNVPEYRTVIGAEHAWCAMLVCGALEETGYKSTRDAGADSFMYYGEKLSTPKRGAVCVIKTGNTDSGYHVTFFDHFDDSGDLVCLGGNQGDSVCYRTYSKSKLAACRWPVKK